ncbi:helix-turn-helix domain-containing protein [Streptomyces laculatispora]|uniref:helix-turn-helix domain-containing protein n=1 Tax=Streptomyces laculatispora TaxID=887464 RepID=UPI001F5E4579|nr:helix-turn-helix transcriptional regulator [Streptomyces laculatispora]
MPPPQPGPVGRRIAYYRSVARPKLTQQQLADRASVALGTIRKIERGERGVTDGTLDAIAGALGVDPSRLVADREHVSTRIREADRHLRLPRRCHAGARAAVAPAGRHGADGRGR